MSAAPGERPVTLITGTSRGIGRYLADDLIARGHFVVGCSRKPIESPPPPESYLHAIADVADEASVKALMKTISETCGRLDGLVNNAGIAAMNHCMLTPLDTVRRVLETNVVGTFLLCREAARLMQKRKFGRIVNFATVAVALKLEGEAIYAASKAAVLTLTQILARELAPLGITVNAVSPTPIDTDLLRNVPPKKIEKLLERQAIPRYGTFADVANVVEFFFRKESDFITGQNLYLGGV